MKYPLLFSSGFIGNLEVPNRFVQTPVQTRGGDADGFVTEELLDFHKARCNNGKGPGLVIAQQTFAWPAVKLARGLALWDDIYIEKLARLANAIKAGGSRAFLQLGGSGSRLAGINLAPSPVTGSWDMKRPAEISKQQMLDNMEQYAQAGRRLYEAGFEGFSLHAGAGKYLAQFVSPWSNRRTDEFGGSPANRVRYLIMVINAIREQTRADFPVILRLPMRESIEGGLSLEEGIEQTALLAEAGVNAFMLSSGGQEDLWEDCASYAMPIEASLHALEAVRQALPDITIIANNGLHAPALAERLLARGIADFIGINRPLIADPHYVEKVREDRLDTIRFCIRCNNCQTWERRPHLAGRGMCCTVNPALMVEAAFAPQTAEVAKNVVVVGGGLAGMSAAATLAERGHRVVLYEKAGQLGGQWLAASAGPEKASYRTFTAWLLRRLKEAGVDIRLQHAPDRSEIMDTRPDAVILATGAKPRQLAGVDMVPSAASCGVHILYGLDVLQGAEVPGKKAVVLGGRYIGIESALLLANEGHEVSLVDMGDIGQGMIHRIRGILFRRLAKAGVQIFSHTSLFRITPRCVELAHGGGVFPLECDALILAIGTVPVKTWQECDFGVPTYAIGDCRKIGDAREAVAEGTAIGLRI